MLLNAADKALWRLALPMIFSNITVPLLGLVDTAVIGHLDSPVYLGGVAVGATATSFLFMLLLFSLIASGVIKVDVPESQTYPLIEARRAHEVLESRVTQGSSLLLP